MEEMSDKLRSLFESQRLVYKALEDAESSKDLWWKCLTADPVQWGLAKTGRLRADSDNGLSSILSREPYLAVQICLPSALVAEGVDKPELEPIGFLVLNKSFDRYGAFYMALLPDYQNKGYGRESVDWGIDYAFRLCNVHRLAIGCVSFNTRALHLYSTMGFTQKARLRQCIFMDGKWHDLVDFGILEEEWRQLRGLAAYGDGRAEANRLRDSCKS